MGYLGYRIFHNKWHWQCGLRIVDCGDLWGPGDATYSRDQLFGARWPLKAKVVKTLDGPTAGLMPPALCFSYAKSTQIFEKRRAAQFYLLTAI